MLNGSRIGGDEQQGFECRITEKNPSQPISSDQSLEEEKEFRPPEDEHLERHWI